MEVAEVGGLILLAGLAAVQLISILKKALGVDGGLALLLTYAVCAVLGAVVFGLQGGFANLTPEGIAGALAGVFAVATALYKFVVSKQDE